MNERKFPTAFPLKHQKKDLVLACELGREVKTSLPVAGAAAALYSKVQPPKQPAQNAKYKPKRKNEVHGHDQHHSEVAGAAGPAV